MKSIVNFFTRVKKAITAPFKRPISGLKRQSSKLSQKFSFIEILKSKEIRKKILFTIALIIVYRVLAAVPMPGVDISKLFSNAFGGGSPLNSIFTIITGGRLDSPSVVAIGIGGYINASIIIQLLSSVIPKLEELTKEGERGKRIINQYTRMIAVPLSMVQAYVIYTVVKNLQQTQGVDIVAANISAFDVIVMVGTLTAGSIILMWLGELITEYGIGNGISIILTIGILASLPSLVKKDLSFISQDWQLLKDGNLYVLWNSNFKLIYAILIGIVILVAWVVYITEADRKIPIQYARRIRGAEGMSSSFLPLKINQAGVMPVIFASAILTFPQIIAQLLLAATKSGTWLYSFATKINTSFLGKNNFSGDLKSFVSYEALYFFFIIIFAYFYTFVTFKPSETSDNLKKSGGFIPGLRPGKATENYITQILLRLTFVGSLFLGGVALLPSLIRFTEKGQTLYILSGIGGTSILIIIGVILETIRQIKSLTVSKSYDQYK
ncbi:MAG: preprotein translocase subunit SecY [bacterium]